MASNELTYNIVYRIQGEDKLQKSLTLVESLTGDVKSLEQAVSKSGNATAKQSKALRENAVEQQRNIDRLRRIRDGLEKTDPLYARITNSINKSSKSLGQIDQVQSKYNRTTKRTQNLYKTTLNDLTNLSLSYRDLQSQVRQNSGTDEKAIKKQEELKAESKRLGTSLSQLETDFASLAKKSGLSAAQITKLKQAMVQARNSSINAGRAVQGIGTAFTGTTKVNSSANQLLLSFGDIAQDSAQFSYGFAQGARAIGNNIAFASEQILILRQKMLQSGATTAGFRAVMSTLGAQLMGPVGVIFALNTAITAITMFATRQEALKRKAKETTDELKEQAKELLDLTSQFEIGGKAFGDLTGFNTAIQRLQEISSEVNTLNKRAEELGRIGYFRMESGAVSFYGAASALNQDYIDELEKIPSSIRALESEQNRLKSQYSVLANVQGEVLQKYLELSKEEEAQRLRSAALREDIEKNAQGGREYYNILDELEKVTNKINLADKQRAVGIENVVISQEDAREQLSQLLELTKESNLDNALYADLIERIASGMSGLKDEAKAASDQVDTLKRNIEAGRGIALFAAERTGDADVIRKAKLKELEQRAEDEGLTENEIILEKLKINSEYFDSLQDLESRKRAASFDLRLLKEKDDELEILRIKNEILDQRIIDEKLTEEEIALERAKIQDEFNRAQIKNAEEAYKERQKIISDSMKVEEQIMRSFVTSSERINSQLSKSIQGTFQALIPSSKAAAIAALAIEKAMAIGGVIADTQKKVTELRTEQIKLIGLAAATSFIAPVMSSEYAKGATAIQASITSIKGVSAANIKKIAAIGLFEGAAVALGGGGGSGAGSRGGGGGGSSSQGAQFGFRSEDVQRSPQFLPRSESSMASGKVDVQILADRKQLYAMVKNGQEEYRQISVS